MADGIGRREANKEATRKALSDAAKALFVERGYESTTIRDIADRAGVNERTFYRYFDGKEGLVAESARGGIEAILRQIRERPAEEEPMAVVETAMLAAGRRWSSRTTPLWFVSDGPTPFQTVRRFWPRALRNIESSVAEALLERGGGDPTDPDPDDAFKAEVTARAAVAVLRSVIARYRSSEGEGREPDLEGLMREGFALLRP